MTMGTLLWLMKLTLFGRGNDMGLGVTLAVTLFTVVFIGVLYYLGKDVK